VISISKEVVSAGISFLGVSSLKEAVFLRKNGFNTSILNLVSILPDQASTAVKYGISQSVSDISIIKYLNKEAYKQKRKAKIHIKVDTGMRRLGVSSECFGDLQDELSSLKNIVTEGIYTHFASADSNKKFTLEQLEQFKKSVSIGVKGKTIRHSANSSALINFKETHIDMVRPGLMLYGLYPSPADRKKVELKPVLSWKTKVIAVKEVKRGDIVSYGGEYKAVKDTKVAVLSLGYAFGFSRLLSNKGNIMINGVKYPVAGRVCMDITMVDIGKNSSIKKGDTAVIIGRSGKNEISADDLAEEIGTISYEIVSGINRDIKRVFVV
jgi:alanine racemase